MQGDGERVPTQQQGLEEFISVLTSFRVRMLSWMGLGKPTTVLVSLERRERARLGAGRSKPEPPTGRSETTTPKRSQRAQDFSAAKRRATAAPTLVASATTPLESAAPPDWLCGTPPAQGVADELAAAGLQEHLNVLFSAAKGKGEESHLPVRLGTPQPQAQGIRKSLVVR